MLSYGRRSSMSFNRMFNGKVSCDEFSAPFQSPQCARQTAPSSLPKSV